MLISKRKMAPFRTIRAQVTNGKPCREMVSFRGNMSATWVCARTGRRKIHLYPSHSDRPAPLRGVVDLLAAVRNDNVVLLQARLIRRVYGRAWRSSWPKEYINIILLSCEFRRNKVNPPFWPYNALFWGGRRRNRQTKNSKSLGRDRFPRFHPDRSGFANAFVSFTHHPFQTARNKGSNIDKDPRKRRTGRRGKVFWFPKGDEFFLIFT